MNSLERFMGTLAWSRTDRRCCLPLVLGYAAKLAGIKVKEYVSDGEAMALAQRFAIGNYGYDAVFVYAGNAVEVESMGAPLDFPEDDYPYVNYEGQEEIVDGLLHRPLPDPTRDGRMPQLLKAARILRQEVGQKVPVVGSVAGPLTIAGQLLGLEQMLFLLADNPERFRQLINYTAPVSMNFGLALLDAGARVIMLMDPVSSQNIIPPGVFQEVELPLIRRIFAAYKEAGALACWLVITGQTRDLLASYPLTNADMVTVDYPVPLEEAFSFLPHVTVTGNLDPFHFIDRSPEEIRTEARGLLQSANSRPGYILGTGCELPLNSKAKNLQALVSTV